LGAGWLTVEALGRVLILAASFCCSHILESILQMTSQHKKQRLILPHRTGDSHETAASLCSLPQMDRTAVIPKSLPPVACIAVGRKGAQCSSSISSISNLSLEQKRSPGLPSRPSPEPPFKFRFKGKWRIGTATHFWPTKSLLRVTAEADRC
jgi:hypothetical protein